MKETEEKVAYLVYGFLVPLSINLLASLVFSTIPAWLIAKCIIPTWTIVAFTPIVFAFLTFLNWQKIVLRSLRLQVYKEVSAARCGEAFLRLARYLYRTPTLSKKALPLLKDVVEFRRHPNTRFLQLIQKLSQSDPSSFIQEQRDVQSFLKLVPLAMAQVRVQTIKNVSSFLSALTHDDYLVLYGYSSTVCESVVRAGANLLSPIFLIQDLQYGVEGSLGEHILAREALKQGNIEPFILPFDQLSTICSSDADFVTTKTGERVPLAKGRRMTILVGCEASDTGGRILIPSRLKGKPSETAKFVEVARHASSQGPQQASVERRIVVVTESYKIYQTFETHYVSTKAPLKLSTFQSLLFILGIENVSRFTKVDLVELIPSDLHAVIDDSGVHVPNSGEVDLRTSLNNWEDRTINHILPRFNKIDPSNILEASDAIVFDLNGVLRNDEPQHFAAFADVLRQTGNTLTHQEYLQECSGLTDQEGLSNLLTSKGLTGNLHDLVEAKRMHYNKHVSSDESLAFPKAFELVELLFSAGKRCFLVTSSPRDDAEKFLTQTRLAQFFKQEDRFLEVNSVQRKKVYSSLIHLLGGNSSRCFLFDDSPANIRTAVTSGIRAVAFTTNRLPAEFVADVVVKDCVDLYKKLNTTFNPMIVHEMGATKPKMTNRNESDLRLETQHEI